METKTAEIVRTTIDLPIELNKKLLDLCEKTKRSRHAEMLFILEKNFENAPDARNGKKGEIEMSKILDFGEMFEFCNELNVLRQMFPELAPELDKCLFEVLNNHTPKCGHGSCSCQTMTLENFHAERNLKFGTISEARYEFN